MKRLRYSVMAIGVAIVLLFAQPLQAQQQACDPSYPTVCIAPPPPDLDCADVSVTHCEVRQPDPDHFDGNQDGVDCEV